MRNNNIIGITFKISSTEIPPYFNVIYLFKEVENYHCLYKQFYVCCEKIQRNKLFADRESITTGSKIDFSWVNVMTVVNVE